MNRVATEPTLTVEARRYLTDIRRIKLLDQDEEHMLAKRFREHNDVDAAQTLVTSHLHLALTYRGYGLPIGEIISEGNIGLIRAVNRFDPDKAFRLTSCAIWWIRSAIYDNIFRSWSMVKIGTTANHKKLFFKLRRTKGVISAAGEGNMGPDQVNNSHAA